MLKSHINIYKLVLFIFTLSYFFIGCEKDDDNDDISIPQIQPSVPTPYQLNTGRFDPPVIAPDNPLSNEGVRLGKLLFYEKKLSKDGSISCATCHQQSTAFTDTNRFSTGVRGLKGGRQAMSVFNMAWNTNKFFWDGRAHLLRDQALMPIQDTLEMDESLENVVLKLSSDPNYPGLFNAAFGSSEINELKISLALEQFMNSIVSVNSKYDQYLAGTATLDSNESRGLTLFMNEFNPSFPSLSGADCQHCHSGLNFQNNRYSNNGLDIDAEFEDLGLYNVSGRDQDKAKFKITSLRNIALTPPYMHDGRFGTLMEVLDHYNEGMKNSSTIDPALLFPLNAGGLLLSEEDKKDIIAFLNTLTDQDLMTNPEYSDPF